MAKIDTSGWKKVKITDIFEMNNTKSIVQKDITPDSGETPYVTAQAGSNGIMTYINCPDNWLEDGNCIMIGGKTLTFSYQAKPFCSNDSHNIVLYLKDESNASELRYLFLIASLRGALCQKYSWGDSISLHRIKEEEFWLPYTAGSTPDWAYMDKYMSEIMAEADKKLDALKYAENNARCLNVSEWREFVIGDLFPNIVKPPVLHSLQVVEKSDGIPYIVRTKFNNGVKCRVYPVAGVEPSPAGVITWGAENAAFFYQKEPFLSGRDIYYIDTRKLSMMTCLFLASCFQTVVHKYPYNFGLFPELLKKERIKLPVTHDREPDWGYMDLYMRERIRNEANNISNLSSAIGNN